MKNIFGILLLPFGLVAIVIMLIFAQIKVLFYMLFGKFLNKKETKQAKEENKDKDCTTCKNARIKDFCYLICDIDGVMNDVVKNCSNYEEE